MSFRRMRTKVGLMLTMAVMAFAAVAGATPLSPFIDLQEKGLTLAGDGAGLVGWGGVPKNLTVTIGGPVRFALLYWAGRERPCVETPAAGSGDCSGVAEPFKDQEVLFDGASITGTIIGTETQPVTGGGPIFNIGYFADVTSLVSAKGAGTHSLAFGDGNPGSNLWRLDGATLIVGFTTPGDNNWYRVLVGDGLDSAFGPDPTPGDTRVTAPYTFNHGINLTARTAELWLALGDGTADRPDHVTISNNATIFNGLDGSNGPQWDTDKLTIDIPAGVGTTTVQAFSQPNNQNPDSLLWQVAALRVRQLDAAKPTCPITLNDPGPPARVEVTIRDTGTGIAEILVTRSENADTVVPPFTVGTTDPIVLSSTKIDQTKRARVEARVTDLAGNVALCDPILLLLVNDKSESATLSAGSDVPRAEHIVTITNGTPGLKKIEIVVNGKTFKVAGLKDGEETTVDIAPAMVDGDANQVDFQVKGKPGSYANVMIWDGIGE
ncbi:MAG TPA: hypothetical protein VN493_24890 [Thermoanaerobaculia bacterium]|nr:hypothetical protein [Thermoanaerobaculia bacterium]